MLLIYQTGVREGEFLRGTGPQNRDSKLQVKGFYPPSLSGVERLEVVDYRDKLKKLEFFKEMSEKEIRKYLNKKAVGNSNLYLNDVEGLKVRFLSLSGTAISRLNGKQQETLLAGKYLSIAKVSTMFDKPGSTAGRKNMVFRGDTWAVMPEEDTKKKFQGVLVSLDGKCEQYKGKIDTKYTALVEGGDIAISLGDDVKRSRYTKEDIEELFSEYPDSSKVRALLHWASPSIHKSLVQKMIRTRCRRCSFFEEEFSGRDTLVTSFIMLLLLPGKLVPELKVFESGLLSATKRSAVTIAEDSNVERPEDLLRLFAAAYYAKTFAKWKPSIKLIRQWVDTLLEAYEHTSIYKYKLNKEGGVAPLTKEVKIDTLPLNICYYLLLATKALKGDYPMVGWIARYKGALSEKYTRELHINVPIVHCIDQHNISDIVWHFPYETVKDLGGYPGLLRKVWRRCSSANARKGNVKTIEDGSDAVIPDDPSTGSFVSTLRTAQYSVWMLRCFTKSPRTIIAEAGRSKYRVITYKLDDSWIAGLIGKIVITLGNREVYVVCNANDTSSFHAIPLLRRKEKEYDLEDKDTKLAVKALKEQLRDGITVKVPPSLKTLFPKLTITLKRGEYKVNNIPWETFSNIELKLPLCTEELRINLIACLYTGDCIEIDMEEKVIQELNKLNTVSKVRLMTYVAGVSSVILMNKVSMKGGSTEGYVVPEDTAVYTFLCSLAVIAPAALEPVGSKFVVKNGPLMRHIVDLITDSVKQGSESDSTTEISQATVEEWIVKKKSKKYKNIILRQHQINALERMQEGYRHIIYITAGLGKTLITIDYIKSLIELDKMPKYCVYTLPPSAYEGVSKQFKGHGLPINFLDMTKNSINSTLLPYCVNFIKHDHMRLGGFYKQAASLANDTLFIADEFHLAMSNTERTYYAVSLATIAKYMIAMTGTLITGGEIDNLISWLKLVSKFEVTADNYIVAVGGLIASRIKTKVQVIREEKHIDLSRKEKKEHDTSFNDAVRVCYEVITENVAKLAYEYIEAGTPVFIVTKDLAMQQQVRDSLKHQGVKRMHLITKDAPIHYEPGDKRKLQAIITTVRQATGYTITGMSTMITAVYFSNQATREQLDARLNRLGQPSASVKIVTLHCGLLSYVLLKYDKARTLSDIMKQFAEVADIPTADSKTVRD